MPLEHLNVKEYKANSKIDNKLAKASAERKQSKIDDYLD